MKKFLILLLLAGCVTSKDFAPAKVIERSSGRDETPPWTHAEVAMGKDGADVFFVGALSMGGDAREEACLKAAELDAKASILRHIKDNITSSGQLNDQMTGDPSFEQLTAFLSQGQLVGVATHERYWERREESDTLGDRVLKLHCAVKVTIRRVDLEHQLQAALGNGGNAEIRAKLIQAQGDFIENLGQ